jgi:uncharacterized membrane protein YkoI
LDFTNLQQLADDTPLTFANRVHDTVIQWTKLLSGKIPKEEDITIPASAWAGSGLTEATAPDAFKTCMRRNIREARMAQHTLTNNYFGHSTCRKIIISGLADQKLKDKVMDCDRRGDAMEQVKIMIQVEQRKISRYHKAIGNKKPVMTIHCDNDDYDEEVDAINHTGKKNNSRRKNNGGNAKNGFGNTNAGPINQALGHRFVSETTDERTQRPLHPDGAGAIFRGRGRGGRRGGRAPRGSATQRPYKECTYCMKAGHEEKECFTKENVLYRGKQELNQQYRISEAAPSYNGQQQQPGNQQTASTIGLGNWYPDSDSVN